MASSGIQQVAETGNSSPLLTALGMDKHVFDIADGTHPLVPAGSPGASTFPDSVTLTKTSGMGAKYLSFASMLICTNDGFTGLDNLRLPKRVGDSVMVTTSVPQVQQIIMKYEKGSLSVKLVDDRQEQGEDLSNDPSMEFLKPLNRQEY